MSIVFWVCLVQGLIMALAMGVMDYRVAKRKGYYRLSDLVESVACVTLSLVPVVGFLFSASAVCALIEDVNRNGRGINLVLWRMK